MPHFSSDLPLTAATVIPLVLIAATVDARLLDRWTARLDEARKEKDSKKTRQVIGFILAVGWSMLGIGFAAEFAAFWELYRKTNSLDGLVFGGSCYIIFGLAVSFMNKMLMAAGFDHLYLFRPWKRSRRLPESPSVDEQV